MSIQLILILSGSFFLIFISRRSLSDARVHGFYRFFAFELILLCIVLNLPVWFKKPFAIHQLASWLLLITSIYPACAGFYLLGKAKNPGAVREKSANFAFEDTSCLVKSGPYRYIRHPMYTSLVCLAWGAALKRICWWSLLLALAATVFLYLTARIEEAENIGYFGEEYLEYKKKTRMLIPFIW
jgi:protein-S-isoprenylcysteine O-methyltransferase Ste14